MEERMTTQFESRSSAAQLLAERLIHYRGERPLVLAIPRGAVPMGAILADALEGDLDVVLVRKLGAPGNPELAVGAIDETGWTYVADFAAKIGADAPYIEQSRQVQLRLLRERRARYTPCRAPIDPEARIVIVVDDGLATGATMLAALHAIRAKRPARIVCAVPVAPPECLARLHPQADEVVCLQAPTGFYAVGQYYLNFDQVDDEDVVALLAHRASSQVSSPHA